jgi:hypothetical protein
MHQADAVKARGPIPRRGILLAALPVMAWLATGLTLVPEGERDVIAGTGPAAVLHAGIHLVTPWPFRRPIRLDDGAVHDIPLTTAPALHVFFRIGLTDNAAILAASGISSPDALVAALAARDALNVQDAPDRATRMQAMLTPVLAASGLDLIAIAVASAPTLAAMPPDTDPQTTLEAARSAAATTRLAGQSQAASGIAAARAKAAEIVDTARTELVTFTADQAAAKAGGRAFLLERYFANLSRALALSPKTIIDHRLNWPQAPELDLRPPSGIATGETSK